MIPRDTVEKIVEAARIEEVLGEFITLRKRGTNLIGLCPFHGEKTPSFTVSPVKGIYKCFGCSKAGNSVNFIMDHLSLSYPEALKWLAKKYGIEVVEKELSPEEKEKQTEKDSMLIVMQYAQRYFSSVMHETDEGKSVGLGYFLERGLRSDIIEKFQLGYSPEARRAFSEAAVKAGYQPKYLVKTGMSILSNSHQEGSPVGVKDIFDRYAGRVMFPIHDDAGRVVAFGGRTLSSDKRTAKYINSPETDIYHKSRILYGLWLGKKAIQRNERCYLVEGYMDVIAMHQAGIENVVASSGTSLTIDQIRAIHRFTTNIVVLYDGDEAGQKASARAIPLLLAEGMNVKLLMFPDNDDPDSFSRKVTPEQFRDYLEKHTEDFLIYKAKKISGETKNDPIRKAVVIKDLVENIALIPDAIIRSVYIKECAALMDIEESVLQIEVNKLRRKSGGPMQEKQFAVAPAVEQKESEPLSIEEEEVPKKEPVNFDAEEKELLRIMLHHGRILVTMEAEDENEVHHEVEISLAEFILFELWRDNIRFENPIHQEVLEAYMAAYHEGRLPDIHEFKNSPNPLISSFVINHAISSYELSSKWENFGVYVAKETVNIKKAAQHIIFSLKEKKLNHFIYQKQEQLREAPEDLMNSILKDIIHLTVLKSRVNKLLGRIIVK